MNIILVVLFITYLEKYTQAAKTVNTTEQKLYREYIGNEEHIKTSLQLSIKNENNINPDELTQALNYNFTNINLDHSISIPSHLKSVHGVLNFAIPGDLNMFHLELNAYIFQLVKRVHNGTSTQTDIKDIKAIIQTMNRYEKTLHFGYYDKPTVIEKKLEKANTEVMYPFMKSNDNPFYKH